MPLVSFIHKFTFVCSTKIEEMTYLADCIQDEMKSLCQDDASTFLYECTTKHCFTSTESIELVRTIEHLFAQSVSSNRQLHDPIRIQYNIFITLL